MARPLGSTARAAVLAVLFPALALIFAGALGLITAVAMIAVWLIIDPPPSVMWAGSAVLLAVAPFILFAEGLPTSDVVGAQFGVNHLAAHRAVTISLLLASFASLLELFRVDRRPRRSASEG
jgi:hypothetical protein